MGLIKRATIQTTRTPASFQDIWCRACAGLKSTGAEVVRNVMAHGDAWEGKWRGNRRLERVTTTTVALYLGTRSIHSLPTDPHSSTASSQLDSPADLNGLVHFSERPNLVSAHVPSRFKRALPETLTDRRWETMPGIGEFTCNVSSWYSKRILVFGAVRQCK